MKSTLSEVYPRISKVVNRPNGIVNYDDDNLYPQRTINIVAASGTGSACVKMHIKFLIGGGFKNEAFAKTKLNSEGLTANMLLEKMATAKGFFGKYAIHVNYNAAYERVALNFIPFEFCRLTDDTDIEVAHKVAIYDDWGRMKRRTFDRKRIQFVDFYNPDPQVVQQQVDAAGGWKSYKGQLFYPKQYVLAPYDAILEDIQTDTQCKIFKFRNVSTNFMASHLLITDKIEDGAKGTGRRDFDANIQNFQGAENAGKILHVEKSTPDSQIDIKKFEIQNVENIFSFTEQSCRENIIRNFLIPPVLMGILQAGKLGTSSEIEEATDFYNGITEGDRQCIENDLKELLSNFSFDANPSGDYSIIPHKTPVADRTIETEYLQYFSVNEVRESKGYEPTKDGDVQHLIDTLGTKGVTSYINLMTSALLPQQKADSLVILLGIDQETANKVAGVIA